jgi:hypothetical protein
VTTPLLLLIGVAAVIVVALAIALLDLAIRRATVGATLVFLSAIAQAVFIYDVPSVHLGGMRVGATDLVAIIVLSAGVARCLRLRSLSRHQHWLVLLASLLLVSLVLGIATIGVKSSVNEARQYLFFIGSALYMATFRPTSDLYDRIGRAWLIASILMVLLACARWVQLFGGINLGVPAEIYGVDTAIRVLDGPYGFFLTGPLLLTVPFWMRRGRRRWVRWLGAVLLIVVVVLDRRTVWVAVLIGVAVLLLRGRRVGPRAIALVVAASVVTLLAFGADVLARDQAPPGTLTSTGSVSWRVEGWSDLVDSWSATPLHWLIGEPLGSGFARVVDGSEVTAHPHNFYIETMLTAGIGGLIALLALTVGLLRTVWRVQVTGPGLLAPGMLAPLLTMQLIWSLTWTPGLEQGIVTGMAIAVAAACSRRTTAASTTWSTPPTAPRNNRPHLDDHPPRMSIVAAVEAGGARPLQVEADKTT